MRETVVPSACRRTRAKKQLERSGNDDNDAARSTTNRRRLLRRAHRADGRESGHERNALCAAGSRSSSAIPPAVFAQTCKCADLLCYCGSTSLPHALLHARRRLACPPDADAGGEARPKLFGPRPTGAAARDLGITDALAVASEDVAPGASKNAVRDALAPSAALGARGGAGEAQSQPHSTVARRWVAARWARTCRHAPYTSAAHAVPASSQPRGLTSGAANAAAVVPRPKLTK